MESIDPRIERMKDRIEDLQEQDFEKYQSDIADTIALRVWKNHNGDIDAILAKEYVWRFRAPALTPSALLTGRALRWRQSHTSNRGGSVMASNTPPGCC